MNRKKMGAVVLVSLLLAAGGVVIWLIPTHRAVRSFKLPDGTTWSVFRVTYGTNHELIYANDWRDHFARFVPARYATNLGFIRMRMPSTSYYTNALIVWMKRSGPVPAPAPTSLVNALPRVSGSVVDDDGLEASTSTIAGNGTFMGWLLPNYPRHSRIIHLRCWDTSTPATGGAAQPRLAELEIPNPARSTAAPLVAETPPAVQITNGLEISLVKLETGYTAASAGIRGGGRSSVISFAGGSFGGGGIRGGSSGGIGIGGRGFLPASNSRAYSLARVEFREHGQPTTNWTVQGFQAAAPPGSAVTMPVFARPASAGANDYYLGGVLWPEEPAWEVTIKVARQADFPAEETWKITGIPVPEADNGQSDFVPIETNLSGMHLVFLGASPIQTASSWSGPTSWTLNLTSDYLSDLQPKLVSLRTGTGQILQPGGFATGVSASAGGGGPTATYEFRFSPPEGTTTVDATFAVSQPRYVTFRVKTTLAQ